MFSRLHSEAARRPDVAPRPEAVPPEEASVTAGLETEEAETPRTEDRWALPLAFGVAFVLNSTGCGRLVVYATASNWAHELGHASWRWLNGRSAFPTLFFTFYSQPGRSAVFTLLVLGGLLGLFVWARREECFGLAGLVVLFFLVFLGLLALPPGKEHVLESFAGLFGEFWISTLWVLLFYYRFPDVVRWERLRWVFLFLGAAAYTRILGVFWKSRQDMTLLPWGSFFGGDGDLDRLLSAGWLVPFIRRTYFTTAAVCALLMAAQYLYFEWRLETSPGGQLARRSP